VTRCLHPRAETGALDRADHLIRWFICHDCGHSYFIDVPRHATQPERGVSRVDRRLYGRTDTFVDWTDGKEHKEPMSTNESNGFKQFCIVELFGHSVIAGLVSEQTIGGTSFVRVDVPETAQRKGYTKLFGAGAIYAMTPVDEATALAAAKAYSQAPIQEYQLRAALPSGSRGQEEYDDEDDDIEDDDDSERGGA